MIFFSRGAPAADPAPTRGTIAIEPGTVDGASDPSLPAFADAAAAALTARGFTILDDPGHAAYALELVLSRQDVGTSLARVPGQRAATIGAGVVVPLSTGKSDLVRIQRICLEMRIRRRGQAGIVWHGAAVSVREADARRGTDRSIAIDLSQALLRNYPTEPSGLVGVP